MALKVEGTLDELMELFGPGVGRFGPGKKSKAPARRAAAKVKRPLNSWQKYLKANKNKFRIKSGKRKNQIDFAKASRAFKKTPAGKKVKR
jgi:hypothetical protein